MRITEDTVWRYYNCPDPEWSSKCRLCREKVNTLRTPVEECVNCWKVEIWKHGTAFSELGHLDFDVLMDKIEMVLDDASKAKTLGSSFSDASGSLGGQISIPVVAKSSRAPIQIVRTGVPLDGYPSLVVDDFLTLYAKSIGEREALRDLLQAALDLSDNSASLIPVRRGCWRFDRILGPWQRWYPPHADWT